MRFQGYIYFVVTVAVSAFLFFVIFIFINCFSISRRIHSLRHRHQSLKQPSLSQSGNKSNNRPEQNQEVEYNKVMLKSVKVTQEIS